MKFFTHVEVRFPMGRVALMSVAAYIAMPAGTLAGTRAELLRREDVIARLALARRA